MTPFRKIYLWLWAKIIEPWILPRRMSQKRLSDGYAAVHALSAVPGRASGTSRFWFHAASVGELESLWPVVEALARSGSKEGNATSQATGVTQATGTTEIILTVFSESAAQAVLRLGEAARNLGATVLYAGASPWEGYWAQVLGTTRPDYFVSAKYEAWPDLWTALSLLRIPLVIVGAKARRSLRAGKWFCEVMGVAPPETLLLPVLNVEMRELQRDFPKAEIHVVGEPRWERVMERAKVGSVRARTLIEAFRAEPRPWGILGSVWAEDLEIWREQLVELKQGLLWVVPHKIGPAELGETERLLESCSYRVIRSSTLGAGQSAPADAGRKCILVDEMGFLSELYSAGDWAYVGGGFGQGVHSTIEPAIHGIPIACGPRRADKFSEIRQLREAGQLTLVRSSEDLRVWLVAHSVVPPEKREVWKRQVEERKGADQRVLAAIRKLESGRSLSS